MTSQCLRTREQREPGVPRFWQKPPAHQRTWPRFCNPNATKNIYFKGKIYHYERWSLTLMLWTYNFYTGILQNIQELPENASTNFYAHVRAYC